MPKSFVDPQSLKEFEKNLRKVADFTDQAIVEGLEVAANQVMEHAKANHPSNPKTGGHPSDRFYTVTGLTVAGIFVDEVEANRKGASVRVVSSEPHSAALEFGTPTARAYPFLGPALEETQEQSFRILAAAVSRALGG